MGIALAAALAACAGESPNEPQASSPAAKLVHEGDAQLVRSNFSSAHSLYEQALDEDPEYAPAYSRLAYALLFDPASQTQAVLEARRATELQPQSAQSWAYLARALDWNGELDEALEAAERAQRLNPNDPDALSFLAEVLADLRMFDDARANGEQAVRLDPQNAEAHRNLGYVYAFMGRNDDALAEYQRAFELEPEFVHRMTSLAAHYLFDLDNDKQAAEWLSKSIEIAPDDYITLLFSARLNSHRGAFDEALEACGRILEQAPNASAGYNCQGSVLLDAGLRDGAIQARLIAIQTDPDDYAGYVGLGYAYYARGDCDLAAAQFERAVELRPRSGGNHAALGFANACLQLWEQAKAAYEKAIELEPFEGNHHILLGRMYLTQGDFETAEREIRAAIDLNPENDDYVAWLGRLYAATGQIDRALAEFTRASDMDPDDGSHELAIGFTLLRGENDPGEASVYFLRAQTTYYENGARPSEVAQASYGLALTHLEGSDCGAAIPHLQEAVRLDSNLVAAGEYLIQCRLASATQESFIPTAFLQRSQYAGDSGLDALRQTLALMGHSAQVEFTGSEDGKMLMFVGYEAFAAPDTPEFLSEQSMVAFASSLVAARTAVPEVSRLAIVSIDEEGEAVGALEILVRDARLWDLGIVTDAGFASQWRSLQY